MKENRIITIGRQLGSGGREIGERLSKELGIAYYDEEIIRKAAVESGISKDVMASYDEKPTTSLLYSFAMNATSYIGNDTKPLEMRAYLAQIDAIKNIADSGPCVIVGRGADHILSGRAKLIKVFVVADMDYRIHRVMERRKVSEEQARILIQKTDKSRAVFYNYHTDQKWGNARDYDLCVNSAKSGTDGAVDLVKFFLGTVTA